MNINKYYGTGVAIVTPFRKDGSVDFSSLGKLVDFLITNNINYLVVQGTTGESVTISKDEKDAIVNFIIEKNDGRVPIMLGIGGNSTYDVINKIKEQNFDGIDSILSVSPYYNKPTQEGIIQHYTEIANSSPVPVMLYNVPGRTSMNMTAETTLKLAEHKNIFAMKEASGNISQMMTIIKNKPNDFLLISGDDGITLPVIAIGGVGIISVAANAFPKEMTEMVNNALKYNIIEAQKHHYKLLELFSALFEEGNPSGVKAALEIKGIISNHLRLPLIPVSQKLYDKINDLIKKL